MFVKVFVVYIAVWIKLQYCYASPDCPMECICSRKSEDEAGKKIICRNSDTPVTGVEILQTLTWPEEVVHIDFSGNEITSLKNGAFKEFSKLEKLNLSNNGLVLIEPGAFLGLHNLQKLDLSENRISILNSSILDGMPNLERLFLGGNRLKTIEEGTFAKLTKLKRLDLGSDQVRCDCHMSWVVGWLQNSTVKLSTNSTCDSPPELRGKLIKDMTHKDLHCDRPPDLDSFQLNPSASQILFQGDKLPFECEASASEGDLTLVWLRKGLEVKDNASLGVHLYHPQSPDRSAVRIRLLLDRVEVRDSGAWQCMALTAHGNTTRSVNILVVPQDAIFCPQVVTYTNRGTFVWKNTFASTTPHQNCQSKSPRSASYKCNSAGQWEDLDVSQCPYTSEVTRTLQQCANIQGNASDTDVCTTRLQRYITDAGNITDKDDVIYMAQILERLVDHMTSEKSVKLSEVVLNLASLVVDVSPRILYAAQQQERACSRIVEALERMPVKQLATKTVVSYTSDNIAYHALQVREDSFGGLTCRSAMRGVAGGYSAGGFECDNQQPPKLDQLDEKFEASIHIPKQIFSYVRCLLNECSHEDTFIIEVIVYRKASLFPQFAKNSGKRIETAVISAKIVDSNVVNTSHPVVIHLQSRVQGLKPQAVYWDFNANGEFGGWVPFGCSIQDEEKNFTEIHCRHLTNFALLQETVSGASPLESWLASTFSMSAMVYTGSSVLCFCLLATIVSYILCRSSLYMPKKLKHCIPNLCLCLLCLCVTYTIGVRSSQLELFCEIMAISIHYFSLCVLTWIAITTYMLYKKLQKASLPPEPPDPEGPAKPLKPVLGLYLLGWGLALLLCGIVAAINSLQHYSNPHYCFLLPGARIYAFYVPAGSIIVVITAFFLCICCTIYGYHDSPGFKHPAADELDTEETQVRYDENDTLTNIDSITPMTNLDSVVPAVVYRNASSNLTGLTSLSHSSSMMDIQYRPVTHLKGIGGLLLLFVVTWTCGALAVALPFTFIHQEIVFNCLYLLFSVSLGVYILIYFVFGRHDGRLAWRRTCCCDKTEEYDLNQSGSCSTNLRTALNGHLVQSASSIEGSQYTNKSSSNTNRSDSYRYGPMGHIGDRSDVSILNTNVPTITDSSIMPEYPNFFNEKQNGIAKKYWQKTRQKQRIAQLNKELKSNAGLRHRDSNSRVSFDDSSDQNTHISLEIQLEPQAFNSHLASLEQTQNFYNSLTRQYHGIPIDGPGDNLRAPLVPYNRYQIAPMVGMSSPPSSSVLLPPDGGSCISTEISSHVIPPAPMTSPQSSGINCVPPSSHHSLPRPGHGNAKHVVPHYMQRNGSVPRLRDFDGKSSTSRETRPLSVGSDSQTMDSSYRGDENNTHNGGKPLFYSHPDSGRAMYSNINGQPHSNRNNNGASCYNAIRNGGVQRGVGQNGFQTHTRLSSPTNVQNMCISEEPNLNDTTTHHVASKPPVVPKPRTASVNNCEAAPESKRRKPREQTHNPKHHKRKGSGPLLEPFVSAPSHSSNIAKIVRTNSSSMDETEPVVNSSTGLLLQTLDNEAVNQLGFRTKEQMAAAQMRSDSNGGMEPEEQSLLLTEERLNILNGNVAAETAGSDIWIPQNPKQVKPKNMETCV